MLINLSGKRFGRLVVGNFEGNSRGVSLWKCRCDCGADKAVGSHALRSGKTQSCGCLYRETLGRSNLRHGDNRAHNNTSPEYRSWAAMKSRCYNPNNISYARYGGVGVSVCEEWLMSYPAFLRDMGRKPSKVHSLDRVNPFGNYCLANCRWATPAEQRQNTRSNYHIINSKETTDG